MERKKKPAGRILALIPVLLLAVAVTLTAVSCGDGSDTSQSSTTTKLPPGATGQTLTDTSSDIEVTQAQATTEEEEEEEDATADSSSDSSSASTTDLVKTVYLSGANIAMVSVARDDSNEAALTSSTREVSGDFLQIEMTITNVDDELVDLLTDIARHARDGSLLVCDWLGRYSYEWQELWQVEEESDYTMDYVVSYIYPEEDRAGKQLEHLTLRLMSTREVNSLCEKAARKAGLGIELELMLDRSVFVGRHMDTRDYNRYSQPLRTAVNSLFETNVRTNLDTLIADYHPLDGFDEVNAFYERYQMSWNALVQYTIDLLYHYDSQFRDNELPEIPESYPQIVCEMMMYIKNIVESCHWIKVGDTRANIIEPQLGYALRELEFKVQRGLGCGHGLVGIYKLRE